MYKVTLFHILVPYESRKTLLDYLSAYDIAKLNECLGHFLDPIERQGYLNPVRDLIWDVSKMHSLIQKGMQLVLLGKDVPALRERVSNTKLYLDKYRYRRRLQIFLVGLFTISGQSADVHNSMIEYSFGGDRCQGRISSDTYQLGKIKELFNLASSQSFLLAFGAPITTKRKGFWRTVPDIPDKSIDLRVYVPSFNDRVWEEVRIPPREVLRISGCVARRAAYYFCNIRRLRIGKYEIERVLVTESGLQKVESPPLGQVFVRFGIFLLGRLL